MFALLREKLFGGSKASKLNAKSRLHFVLVQDRAGLTNEQMQSFKKEMISVIERYFIIESNAFDITYKREGEATTLLINSPVVARRGEARVAHGSAPAANEHQNSNKKKNRQETANA